MTFSLQHLRMVYLPNGLLFEDHLDRRWFTSTGERVTEVIFPSRHAAASGQASLTLHPIGVPHLDEGSVGPYGGLGGSAPPPSTRLASWWRLLLERATNHADVEGFDLSLEVTHHGPFLETPCLFIEVGSTEATWGHTGAANLLAEIIRDGLLNRALNIPWNEDEHGGQLVLITLGEVITPLVPMHLHPLRVCGWVICLQRMLCRSARRRRCWRYMEAIDEGRHSQYSAVVSWRPSCLFDGQESVQGVATTGNSGVS